MYPEQYGRKKSRKLLIGLFILIAVVIAGLIIRAVVSKSNKPTGENALVNTYIGGNASIDLPKNFALTSAPKKMIVAAPPEEQNSEEFVSISFYSEATPETTVDQIEQELTSTADGKVEGLASKQLTRKEQENGRGEQKILRTTSAATESGIITENYYYLYSTAVWQLTIQHTEGSDLDRSQQQIMESFVVGDL